MHCAFIHQQLADCCNSVTAVSSECINTSCVLRHGSLTTLTIVFASAVCSHLQGDDVDAQVSWWKSAVLPGWCLHPCWHTVGMLTPPICCHWSAVSPSTNANVCRCGFHHCYVECLTSIPMDWEQILWCLWQSTEETLVYQLMWTATACTAAAFNVARYKNSVYWNEF